jgi:hypothetical protein
MIEKTALKFNIIGKNIQQKAILGRRKHVYAEFELAD